MFRISMLPAEDGDCLLIEVGQPETLCRLLIDGGRASTGSGHLKRLIENLPSRLGRSDIDLMVLTHVDADHIEGLLELLVDGPTFKVGDIWFNGGDHLAMARGVKLREPIRRPGRAHDTRPADVLSVAQGVQFGKLVKERKWPWNGAFSGGPVMIESEGPLPSIPLPGDGTLTLLGPLRTKLAAFAPEWAKWFKTMGTEKEATLTGGRRKRPTPVVETVPIIARQLDDPDRTKPNGTSIAFVVEFDQRRALFAADAHPDDLAAALRRFAPSTDRIYFDAIKVAHHGSARNNTTQLIDRLESPLWLVSTNGSRHEHPDPEAIARIVLTPNDNKTIAFNYRTEFNAVWARPDLVTAYRYSPSFAADDQIYVACIEKRAT